MISVGSIDQHLTPSLFLTFNIFFPSSFPHYIYTCLTSAKFCYDGPPRCLGIYQHDALHHTCPLAPNAHILHSAASPNRGQVASFDETNRHRRSCSTILPGAAEELVFLQKSRREGFEEACIPTADLPAIDLRAEFLAWMHPRPPETEIESKRIATPG